MAVAGWCFIGVPVMTMAGNTTMLLFFYRDGCPWCARMEKILQEPDMMHMLDQQVRIVRINVQGRKKDTPLGMSEASAVRRFKVSGTPTLIFQSAEGKELLRIPGALSKEDFLDVVCQYIPEMKNKDGCGEVSGALPLSRQQCSLTRTTEDVDGKEGIKNKDGAGGGGHVHGVHDCRSAGQGR